MSSSVRCNKHAHFLHFRGGWTRVGRRAASTTFAPSCRRCVVCLNDRGDWSIVSCTFLFFSGSSSVKSTISGGCLLFSGCAVFTGCDGCAVFTRFAGFAGCSGCSGCAVFTRFTACADFADFVWGLGSTRVSMEGSIRLAAALNASIHLA